ncbi:hypothetical protein PPTG_03295 [Phytophthora nicotianae INRA-310]|uniref:Peptidase S1 domain-containing protein n=4 Tax=Phytophthora nicotianae TaxID=4792 RepID=W2R4S9_PHYN3|nr:hypothetical protein PPTG_03295 [Phytophthora nicotianae INRA-310]ETI41494.1 hypothetical protein F443_13267 [Phytophthora nicotianae P1569]ETN20256.1 hypothetical protein PPTG_03295 [Phytophthora nicotianae INRA-310]KUF86650.1 Arginine esterase [Phytophthora nicotianae]
MIRAIEAYRHPLYRLLRSTKGITHDVALLKLERPSKLQPAHLPAVDGSDNKPGVIASALGWGLVNNETSSDILQTVDVEIITNKKCAKLYSYAAENSTVDDSVICAGLGGGKDSCNGDSGGPLLVHDVVVGITSSGPDECGVLPATYARVSNALSFIHDIKAGGSTKNVTERLTAETFTLFDTSQSQEESR